MTICARFDGRPIKECTRGVSGCLCARELIDIAERIAYPRRGSDDENATLQDFADEIRKTNPLSAFDG
jgi:hypothetical protein